MIRRILVIEFLLKVVIVILAIIFLFMFTGTITLLLCPELATHVYEESPPP